MAATASKVEDIYLADSPLSVVRLPIETHFNLLSDGQKRYAHYISKAAYAGARIVLRQCSPESEPIFDLIIALHRKCGGNWNTLAEETGVDESELTFFLEYAAMFLGNLGNYKSFGDSKYVPRCHPGTVKALAAATPATAALYATCGDAMFASDIPGRMHLGYTDDGHLTTYYPESPTITKDEIDAVTNWMADIKLLPENTRLKKLPSGHFEIWIASATTEPPQANSVTSQTGFTVRQGILSGKNITLKYGDHAREMATITQNINKAAENADNETQRNMHLAYAKSFQDGSLAAFKDGQRLWIKDKKPTVECNIGFNETYRDPAGVRGEWDGFASMVNMERTRAFGELVTMAPSLIPLLPWTAEFEKDKFLSPDFTSLEVLTFCGSGVPAGINIPNYDDIRQNDGFKNVSLGNVISSKSMKLKSPFVPDEDQDLFKKYRDASFEVQVGLHELTGHGCGKLLQEITPGVFNFDHKNPPISPLTGKPVTTWYKPDQTWGSVFGTVSNSYEECRAELVAVYLSCQFNILKIFGHGDGTENMDGEAGDILYIIYLSMARSGLGALEMWDPKSQKWGQAHSQARFSILKCFLDAEDDFCKLVHREDDMSDLTIRLDRSKILTAGRKAAEQYLQKLHIYKSTGDAEAGCQFYKHMTTVDPHYWGSKVRDVVLKEKRPRDVLVQANTTLDETTGKVTIKMDDDSAIGMIQSWADRLL